MASIKGVNRLASVALAPDAPSSPTIGSCRSSESAELRAIQQANVGKACLGY
jgi:hypothetical protein|uniref:Uncharacterized protein n=1 Tax=Fagus sylvatica TaxID=28930 RepID=A0A2N9EKQ3_FAGSY